MRKCEKCGAPLVAGENWYAMKQDYVCCDCSTYPEYHAPPRQGVVGGDYEEAILARQET